MRPADLAVRIATEHARDLDYTRLVAHDRRIRRGDGADGALPHDDVVMRAGRDLREM
jgi:hypothetical protein